MSFEKYFLHDDGDEGCSFSLSEREWSSYLSAIDGEAGKFLTLYMATKHIANHLDIIFPIMRWRKIIFNREQSDDGVEVVTFHKSPVYVASKAIFFFIEKIWDVLVSECRELTTDVCWRFAKLINCMQQEMINGIANVDACEFLLSICHFKNILSMVDASMFMFAQLPDLVGDLRGFSKDFATALFDIRELAWQSILVCRESERHYNDGAHFD